MATLEKDSIDAIVTDPPYGLRFMGKGWDHGSPGKEFWTEAIRIVKPGGHLLAFGGTRTFHRLTCTIEDAGFEVRDCLSWLYGSGFPKSHNIGNGRGTALKPAWEPVVMARKPLIGTVASNVTRFGTGAINVDACRIAGVKPLLRTIDSENRNNPILHTRSATNTGETSDVGRWPANVLLDPEAAAALDAQSGERPGMASQVDTKETPSRYFGLDKSPGIREGRGDSGGASRFFYTAKACRAEREEGLGAFPLRPRPTMGSGIGGQPDQQRANNTNIHPTVKPVDLMRWLVRLVTPPGGTVLDPFMGSGTTGIAAKLEGFNFIGIEKEAEYMAIAECRIQNVNSYALAEETEDQPVLFQKELL